MKTSYLFAGVFTLALAMGGCNSGPMPSDRADYVAQLTGREQMPSVDTTASGTAFFWLNPRGDELRYKLTVNNLHDVTEAHLHLGAFGQNGAPVVWLYPSSPPPKEISGMSNGLLREGTITAGNLIGPLAGKSISDLMSDIRAHDIYVNVHTTEHSDGEIRGQLQQE